MRTDSILTADPQCEDPPAFVVACVDDGLAHAVPESEHRGSEAGDRGEFHAVCGRSIRAASLLVAATANCTACRTRRADVFGDAPAVTATRRTRRDIVRRIRRRLAGTPTNRSAAACVMTAQRVHSTIGIAVFSSADHFPLGRSFGRTDAVADRASRRRPYGLRFAESPRSVVRLDEALIGYDVERQIGVVVDRVHGQCIPWSRHTDGSTNTQTNSDGHQGYDSDTDHRED